MRLLATFCTAGAPRAVVSTRLRLPSRSSIITEVVETPCSRNRPSWPIRPGTKGILLMASVSATMEKAELEKMSRAGISVVLLRKARASAGDDGERGELAERGGLLGAGDAGGPDQLGGIDLGEAHDGDALGIGGRGIDRVVEDAGGGLGAIDGGRVERLVLAAGGDLAEDGGGLEGSRRRAR